MEDGRYSPHRETSDTGAPEAQDTLSWEELAHPSDQVRLPKKLPEGILATEAIKKNPKAVFEHVAAAATRKEAVERLYELRQEVKDDPTIPPPPADPSPTLDQTTTAVQIGKILADNSNIASQTPPPPSSVDPVSLPKPPTIQDTPTTPPDASQQSGTDRHVMYRKAVVWGFIMGLALLAALGIVVAFA